MFNASLSAILLACAVSAAAVPASAQGPVAPAASAAPKIVAGKEDPAITARAKDFYRQLSGGALDRSKVTAAVNDALSDDVVKTTAAQLTALGEPKWEYVGQVASDKGPVSLYRLTTRQLPLKLSFGLTHDGKIWDFFLAPDR